jgi:hypothetical protein
MKNITQYFTRLTPNYFDWKKPSGRDGKCQNEHLYEAQQGFGWEEWLFKEYHMHRDSPEFICKGFVQAFNQKNQHIGHLDRLHLYTKMCNNTKDIPLGCYYVGYINNVMLIDPADEIDCSKDLKAVNIHHNNFLPMVDFAKNISFKVNDVNVNFPFVFNQQINLEHYQYRFALYNLENHTNFLTPINNIL